MSLYYLIIDLGMTPGQREILFEQNRLAGDQNQSPCQNLRNHQRRRLDDMAETYEGVFSDLNQGTMISRLAQAGVNSKGNLRAAPVPGSPWGFERVFESRTGGPPPVWVPVMRWIVFGGPGATWDESHDLVLNYLAANAADWEDLENA